jgi:hypothetical protein
LVVVVSLVPFAPSPEDGVRGRHDHVAHRLGARDAVGERSAGQPDPRPELEYVDRPEDLAEDGRVPGGGVNLRGGNLEQRRL